MKKICFMILFLCSLLQMNAQSIYNKDGKFYEIGTVDYELRGVSGHMEAAGVVYSTPSSTSKDKYYRDENGKFVVFKNFAACINYFMYLGWEVLDIDYRENMFLIRREITKEEAMALSEKCIKSRK